MMSKPREDWWCNARGAIFAYPGRRRKLDELRRTGTTPQYGPVSGHGGPSDPVHMAVSRQLPPQQQKELEAVEAALEETAKQENGANRLKIIELYYFRRTHLLVGAGETVGYEVAQTKRINGEFVRLVAKKIGYTDAG